jgi:AcrR family transcriptional regulator
MAHPVVNAADPLHHASQDAPMPGVPRPGTYARGTETVEAILQAALTVLLDEGASAFTIRRIAAACGMKVGNVSYHFPRKEMLVQVLLDDILLNYHKKLDRMVYQQDVSAQERLRIIIVMCLEDIAGKRTTRLFTELWALANQSEFIANRVEMFYANVHEVIGEQVAILNPALTPAEVKTVSLFISAAMEGSTPFLGYEKPWAEQMPAFINLSIRLMTDLAKTVTSSDLAGLGIVNT